MRFNLPGQSDASVSPRRLLSGLGPFLALFLVFGFFAVLNPRMASLGAVETIVQQTVIVGVAAIGMTMVIVSGGIDLSAGSIIALGSVVVAQMMVLWGANPFLAAVTGIAAGALCGAINGLVITRLRVIPFIVTLGTLLIVRGLAKGLANSMPVNVGQTWLSELLAALPAERRWMLVPPGAWLMLMLAALVAGFLHYTPLGRRIFAVGSNEQAARLCGVDVQSVKTFVYTAAGAFSGLAGVMLMSYQEQGDPTAAVGLELDVIAAVVIGGGSLSGGEGSILGSLVGAVIMTVIRTGCQLNGWPTWLTQVVTGAVIVVAVVVDRLRHRQ
ncbi:MAG: ABC transporter permease [candidate division KSB1 bacterium]|nr:ABC transporter permease [candidate division KSB1 bacterium]MDZ7294988.1 ABC transporter permease [candidate division KSB1 bacterium]MDZ7385670.1 ABC transporter permease [candidate division KSB1 bacterium]MDZ7394139.1 ABC transporter permease [candidate division KSB1 bacterium]MDZ7414007.1 ABC transporter permease [candidate division KSB1 bacterium]